MKFRLLSLELTKIRNKDAVSFVCVVKPAMTRNTPAGELNWVSWLLYWKTPHQQEGTVGSLGKKVLGGLYYRIWAWLGDFGGSSRKQEFALYWVLSRTWGDSVIGHLNFYSKCRGTEAQLTLWLVGSGNLAYKLREKEMWHLHLVFVHAQTWLWIAFIFISLYPSNRVTLTDVAY